MSKENLTRVLMQLLFINLLYVGKWKLNKIVFSVCFTLFSIRDKIECKCGTTEVIYIGTDNISNPNTHVKCEQTKAFMRQ